MSATFSRVASATSTACTTITLADAVAEIAGGRHQSITEEIRATYLANQAIDPKSAKPSIAALKRTLPGFLFSGVFTERRAGGLVQHSGLIVADLDELGANLSRVANLAKDDPHAVVYFTSPSGDGMKIVYRCAPTDHAAAFRSMDAHVRSRYGIAPDPSGKDVSRLCFLSHDPAAVVNDGAVPLPAVAATTVSKPVPRADPAPTPSKEVTADTILVLPSNAGITISQAAEKIFGAMALHRDVFTRGGAVVTLDESQAEACLRTVEAAAFRSLLERYGRPYSHRSGEDGQTVLKPSLCPADTATALLASEGRFVLPEITAVSPCPVITFDAGRSEIVLAGKGWSAAGGGVLVTGGELPPEITFVEAVKNLRALLADFDFASPGDLSRAFASLISPALVAGGHLTGQAPLDIAEADESQSGKTFRFKLIGTLYRTAPALVSQSTGGVGSLDETIKAKLVDGRSLIVIDNIRGRLGSQWLESALTANGRVACRLPHKPTVDVDVRRVSFGLTSNGAEATIDLANRSVITRIRKRPASFQFSQWPEGDLLAHVQANQPLYLASVFAVVTHWIEAGRPTTNESRHDFRHWTRPLDWIVQACGLVALLDGHELAKARVASPELSWIRQVANHLKQRGANTTELTASELAEAAAEADLAIPGGRPDLELDDLSRLVGRVMARVFKAAESVQLDGGLTIKRVVSYDYERRTETKCYHFAHE